MRINDILDENEELRYRLGLDPKEPLDMKEFKKNKAIRKEEDRALNFALQGEVSMYNSFTCNDKFSFVSVSFWCFTYI